VSRQVHIHSIIPSTFSHASQAGVNSLLDVARQTYKEANADAAEVVDRLAGMQPPDFQADS
jgi:hypothetical protein